MKKSSHDAKKKAKACQPAAPKHVGHLPGIPVRRLAPAFATFAAAAVLSGSVRAEPVSGSTAAPIRVVHSFDFDERDVGNLEDVPKYWEPVRPRGFPHYAYGAFDNQVGRPAPPSFHLISEGRSVAYHYTGPDTRIRRNTNYRIEGFVRPDRLQHARACLSAHFLDKKGRPITETLVRTRFVGGPGETGDWVKLDLYLPAAPEEAYTIGLMAWVLQRPMWDTSTPNSRHIPRTDIRGGAWFDGITIYALPRAELTSGVPGNVLVEGESQELQVILVDNEDPTLNGVVRIRAADGDLVETHTIEVEIGAAVEPVRIGVGHLLPGLYHAELDVFAGKALVISQKLTFARLDRLYGDSQALARPFGVVIDPRSRSDADTEFALLLHQAVRSAKLPVWSVEMEYPPTAERRRGTDRLLQELVKNGFALTGVFWGSPSAIARSDSAYVRPLIELLSGDPDSWREHVATVVAPYASAFRWWQVGPDRPRVDLSLVSGDQLTLALTQLRDVMRPFITLPRLAISATTTVELASQKLPVDQVALAIGREVQPDRFASWIERASDLGYERVSVYVEPLPAEEYRQLPRLADWAQRIITARFAGAHTVFVPQTWRVRETLQGRVTEPTETYLVLRTIADALGDARPGPRVYVAEGVHCLSFHDAQSTTLAMWDPHAPPEGRRYTIQLGRAVRQLDLWGRSTSLERDEQGRHSVRLSALPVFVPGVERWLIDFRTSLALKPSHIESGVELLRPSVEMAYRGDRAVAGQIYLEAPESWQISPRTFGFSLMPQRVGSHKIELRYPHNEPAGQKAILAKVTLSSESYYLEVPLMVDVGVSDLDVWGVAVVEGSELLLRHVVTNRSSSVLSFRGSANVPGRERQHRPISNLLPGDTQTVEYRFDRGASLIGRDARLVLREVNDGPRTHNLQLRIP